MSRGRWPALVVIATVSWCLIAVQPAAASTTVSLTQPLPTAPVQVSVGDVIALALPPVTFPPPSGYSGTSTKPTPMPSATDTTVLSQQSASYDSGGTAHVTFEAVRSGSAAINVSGPSFVFCKDETTTTSTGAATSTSATSSSTTTSTATSSTFTATPPPGSCVVSDPILQAVSVNVSAAGVQAAVEVPSTGSAGSSSAGLGLTLLGMLAAGGALVAGLTELRRRRR